MFWRFEFIGASRDLLITKLNERNDIPFKIKNQMIEDIEHLLIPEELSKDNYAIRITACGHLSDKARAWESSIQILDINY